MKEMKEPLLSHIKIIKQVGIQASTIKKFQSKKSEKTIADDLDALLGENINDERINQFIRLYEDSDDQKKKLITETLKLKGKDISSVKSLLEHFINRIPSDNFHNFGKLITKFPQFNEMYAVKFSPNGLYLGSGGYQKISLWDYKSGRKIIDYKKNKANSYCLAFDKTTQILYAGTDNNVVLFDIINGSIITQMFGHKKVIRCLDLSNDEIYLATGGEDYTIIGINFF